MGKAGLAVVPIINGFDPTNPDMIDVYSKAGVSIAVGLYQKLRLEGSECKFVLTLPELSNADGAYQHKLAGAVHFFANYFFPASKILQSFFTFGKAFKIFQTIFGSLAKGKPRETPNFLAKWLTGNSVTLKPA